MNLESRVQRKSGHGPLGLGGDDVSGAEGLGRLLHPDVAGVLVRLDEGEVLAVGGDLGAGDLGVAEQQLTIDEGWESLSLEHGGKNGQKRKKSM